MSNFGDFFKLKRIKLGLTLRQFCLQNNLDPGNISKMERGILPPPQHEKLEEYARLLRLSRGSDDWNELFDLAAAESGRIPKDLLADKEIISKLPVLFKTLRGEKVTDEQLDDLIKKIKEKHSG